MTDHRKRAEQWLNTAATEESAKDATATKTTGTLHALLAIYDLLAERLPEPLDPPDTAISVPSSGISWPKAKGGFVPQPSYDAEDFICAGCGRNLPCRHCLDTPKSATSATESDEQPTQAPQDHQDADRASTGRIGWLRLTPSTRRRLAYEVEGGWSTSDAPLTLDYYDASLYPNAKFSPIYDPAVVERVEALAARYEADAQREGYGGELWSTTASALRVALGGDDQ